MADPEFLSQPQMVPKVAMAIHSLAVVKQTVLVEKPTVVVLSEGEQAVIDNIKNNMTAVDEMELDLNTLTSEYSTIKKQVESLREQRIAGAKHKISGIFDAIMDASIERKWYLLRSLNGTEPTDDVRRHHDDKKQSDKLSSCYTNTNDLRQFLKEKETEYNEVISIKKDPAQRQREILQIGVDANHQFTLKKRAIEQFIKSIWKQINENKEMIMNLDEDIECIVTKGIYDRIIADIGTLGQIARHRCQRDVQIEDFSKKLTMMELLPTSVPSILRCRKMYRTRLERVYRNHDPDVLKSALTNSVDFMDVQIYHCGETAESLHSLYMDVCATYKIIPHHLYDGQTGITPEVDELSIIWGDVGGGISSVKPIEEWANTEWVNETTESNGGWGAFANTNFNLESMEAVDHPVEAVQPKESANTPVTAQSGNKAADKDDKMQHTFKLIVQLKKVKVASGTKRDRPLGSFEILKLYHWGKDVESVAGWKARARNSTIEFWQNTFRGKVRVICREKVTNVLRMNHCLPHSKYAQAKLRSDKMVQWGGFDKTIDAESEDDNNGFCVFICKFMDGETAKKFYDLLSQSIKDNERIVLSNKQWNESAFKFFSGFTSESTTTPVSITQRKSKRTYFNAKRRRRGSGR